MMNSTTTIGVRAPGRICLLGEHQDYLGLEVISGALDLAVTLVARQNSAQSTLNIDLTQTGKSQVIPLDDRHLKPTDRDYLLSGFLVMKRKGLTFSNGWTITVTGDLPIGKGVSSSSALSVGWIKLLNAISDQPATLTPLEIAHLAFQAEVKEFNEPGGMQDHLASALGGLLHLDFKDSPGEIPVITPLKPIPDGFLLVDSGETKETIGTITRIRNTVEDQARQLSRNGPMKLSTYSERDLLISGAAPDQHLELLATLRNRDQVRQAVSNWPVEMSEFPTFLPGLIDAHHSQLATGIGTSSNGIDGFIELARDNGALAGKVIGSGGGGCLLIYAPTASETVISALSDAGARVWAVGISKGVSCVSFM